MIRFIYILFLLSKYYILYTLASYKIYKKQKHKIVKAFFEQAGGTFIKMGQILALRVDVLPKEYTLELIDLFDQFKPFPYPDVERIFMQELGAKPEKIFTVFEKTPFASASFAQVHAAKLNDKEIVAVKIQRPGIMQTVLADFFIIDIITYIADLFFKIEALPWREFAKEFKTWTKNELDYHLELENMHRVYNSVKEQKITDVVIPKTYHRLSTKKILVQEYIDGVPLSKVLKEIILGNLDAAKLKNMGIDIKKTPRTMVLELLREYFIDGLFHADPHPGNILLLDNGRIALIDFGIVGDAAPKRKAFLKFMYTGARSKYYKDQDEKMGYYALKFAGDQIEQIIGSVLTPTTEQKDIDGFIELLAQHFYQYYKTRVMEMRKGLAVMKIDYTSVLLHFVKYAQRYQIKLPRQMIVFIRALTIIGFLAKKLDINFNASGNILEFCKNYPEDSLPELDASIVPYKRLSREEAIEHLNNWLAYLVEKDPKLYQMVNTYISRYTSV